MQSQFSDRILLLEGSSNIRDMGGYTTRDGKITRWKTILRSASMDRLTAEAQQGLLDYGVRHIIDLRDVSETESTPNVFAGSNAVRYCNTPVIGVEAVNKSFEGISTLDEMYIIILEQCRGQIKGVLEIIAEQLPNGTVLFHCWAGKDRTGIIAALLLALVGVPPETIAADYAMSYDLLADRIEGWRAYNLQNGHDMTRFEEDVSSRPETMLATLEYLESKLGGVDAYLRSIGLSDAMIGSLRTYLVDEAE
jgi:protein-tyrosine phosphatase